MLSEIERKSNQNFYKIMAENFGDEIFVTDGEGVVLFVNPAAVQVIGKPVIEIIGRNVRELVEEGFFKPSATVEVLEKKATVNIMQTVKGNHKVLCTGVPVFEDDGKTIRMVISTTKDLPLLNEMFETVEEQKDEIKRLSNLALESDGYVSGDEDPRGIRAKMVKVAPLDIPILLQGETGVGKEVTAKAIHKLGQGKEKPFVKINCGIIPEHLIESELFGYEKGAFTGAEKNGKKGKVEVAAGGTLFLDEIGEMPLALQVKLLDFLQDGSFTKVGGVHPQKVETRVIAATNRNLKEMSERGEFRKDLFYRINVVPFEIPPLRERPGDLDALAKHFLTRCNSKYKGMKVFSPNAHKLLMEYEWPGNVRELEHIVELVYVLSDNDVIGESELRNAIYQGDEPSDSGVSSSNGEPSVKCDGYMPLKEAKKEVERQLVERAYEEFKNTYKVAEVLNIDQSTVVKLLKKHHIDR